MADRVKDALAGTAWAAWDRSSVTGDASARRYLRLTGPGGGTVIVMDALPETCGRQDDFVAMTSRLRDAGLAAPEIHHADLDAGLIVMEDLGPVSVADAVAAHPAEEAAIYDAIAEVLIALDSLPPPGLREMTPEVGGKMVGLAALHYAGDPSAERPLVEATEAALARLCTDRSRLALRDVHAENLIWRPDREGTDRIGLLDYQDALLAPAGYDLMSLLRDARRDVSAAVADRVMARVCSGTGHDPDQFAAQCAVLAAQRNLRILGVFARLAANGKPAYADLIPRVEAHLRRDLAHPDLSDLRDVVRQHLPGVGA